MRLEYFPSGVLAPGSDVIVDSLLTKVAPGSGFLELENCVEAELDRTLEGLNCLEMKNEQLNKMILEKCVRMKAVSPEETSGMVS